METQKNPRRARQFKKPAASLPKPTTRLEPDAELPQSVTHLADAPTLQAEDLTLKKPRRSSGKTSNEPPAIILPAREPSTSLVKEEPAPLPPSFLPKLFKKHVPRWMTWVAIFVLGCLVGSMGVLMYISSVTDRPLLSLPSPSSKSAITVRLNSTYLGQVIEKRSTQNATGQLSNVQVQIKKGKPLTISADDQINLLGVSVTKHLTAVIQPYTQACRVQMRVLHADLAGIPATTFTTSVEDDVNQQLLSVQGQLPGGFTYCATSVSTENDELIVTYSAKPT